MALVREFKKCSVGGAARWLGSDRPLICLNLRGTSNDKFWFAFFHECGHILHDPKTQVFVDRGYEESPAETQADEFAANLLIPRNHLPPLRDCPKSRSGVQRLATEIGVHPGIVVGRMQREGSLPFNHLNGLKTTLPWDTAAD